MKKLLFIASLLLATWGLKAQDEKPILDPKFGTNGYIITDFGAGFDEITQVIELQDKKILACAKRRAPGQQISFILLRYNADGSPDKSFGTNGALNLKPFDRNNFSQKILELPDGKIIVAGYAYNPSLNNVHSFVLRLNADGSFDETFGTGGKVEYKEEGTKTQILTAALQADGKIVVAGNREEGFMAMRFNTNGDIDTSFGNNGIASIPFPNRSNAWAVAVQKDGKIVMVGTHNNMPIEQIAVARLNTDGKLDKSFAKDGFMAFNIGEGNDYGLGVVIQEDGKIVIGGHSWIKNAPPTLEYDMAVVRFNPDGTFDSKFGKNGIVKKQVLKGEGNYSTHSTIGIGKDKKIYAAGFALVSNRDRNISTIMSLNEDGTFNNEYAPGGMVTLDLDDKENSTETLAVQQDGAILLGGVIVPGKSDDGKFNGEGFIARLSNAIEGTEKVLDDFSSEVSIFPNPVKETITINYQGDELFSARILDMSGKVVLNKANFDNRRINVSHLPQGNYILQLRSDKKVANKHFVKE